MRVQLSVKMALIFCELYTIIGGGCLRYFYQDVGDNKGKSVAFMFFLLFLISDDAGSCVRKTTFLLLGFLGLIHRLGLIEFLLRIHSVRVQLLLSYLLLCSMTVVSETIALIWIRHFRWLSSFCRIWRLLLFLLLLDFLFHFELIVDDLKGNQNFCGWKRLI